MFGGLDYATFSRHILAASLRGALANAGVGSEAVDAAIIEFCPGSVVANVTLSAPPRVVASVRSLRGVIAAAALAQYRGVELPATAPAATATPSPAASPDPRSILRGSGQANVTAHGNAATPTERAGDDNNAATFYAISAAVAVVLLAVVFAAVAVARRRARKTVVEDLRDPGRRTGKSGGIPLNVAPPDKQEHGAGAHQSPVLSDNFVSPRSARSTPSQTAGADLAGDAPEYLDIAGSPGQPARRSERHSGTQQGGSSSTADGIYDDADAIYESVQQGSAMAMQDIEIQNPGYASSPPGSPSSVQDAGGVARGYSAVARGPGRINTRTTPPMRPTKRFPDSLARAGGRRRSSDADFSLRASDSFFPTAEIPEIIDFMDVAPARGTQWEQFWSRPQPQGSDCTVYEPMNESLDARKYKQLAQQRGAGPPTPRQGSYEAMEANLRRTSDGFARSESHGRGGQPELGPVRAAESSGLEESWGTRSLEQRLRPPQKKRMRKKKKSKSKLGRTQNLASLLEDRDGGLGRDDATGPGSPGPLPGAADDGDWTLYNTITLSGPPAHSDSQNSAVPRLQSNQSYVHANPRGSVDGGSFYDTLSGSGRTSLSASMSAGLMRSMPLSDVLFPTTVAALELEDKV